MSRPAFSELSMRVADLENLAAARAVLSRRGYGRTARDKLQLVFRMLNEIDAELWEEIETLERRT